jgi:hypothetical protein
MKMTATTATTATKHHDAAICNGVSLDKMVEVGPRGGKKTYWRAASKRNAWLADWHPTQQQAAKYAGHLEGVVRV